MTPDSAERKRKKTINDLKAQLQRLGYGPDVGSGDKTSTSIDELRRTFLKKKAKQHAGETASGPAAEPTAPAQAAPKEASRRAPSTQDKVVFHGRLPVPRTHRKAAPKPLPETVALVDATDGAVVASSAGGHYYDLCQRVCDVQGAETLSSRFAELMEDETSELCRAIRRVVPQGTALDEMVFMDIETTGLASSPLFLIGVMVWQEDGFEVRQFLARNYAEERPVIAAFADICADRNLLITFNGKSFDFPYIRTRAAATGLPFALHPAHLDLLHVSRGIWRHALPNCKLQTIERFVCGRQRQDDIPGSQIPDAYHQYVRTDNACQIVRILDHNKLDLITLADIMTRFADEC